ncbi:MAG: aminotransferase class III-fold pyridoxal phosphate-dependent enzyme [Candidatus Lindowbacteria bacterium]|nr:aminotransferase class III-fold pyridoxal phosphate-dependent enzyme [Candidatus Lindowbacteria bacterium]
MDYSINTKKSKRLFDRAQKVLPGGISHNVRYTSPYPIYIKEAYGGKFRDVDGNEFIDYWDGHTGLILGHNPPEIVKALRRAVPKGTHWGLVNKNEVELAELVCEMVPCAEMVRFCCSGTEATMYAVRLARAFTGKKVILKAEGGWHGGNPDLSLAVTPPYDMEESMGLLPEITRYTKAFPVNNLEAVKKLAEDNRDDFAGIIIEPFVFSGGSVPCKPEFLRALRELTHEMKAVLIFDEVITGFRLAPGGGQEYFGITPDLWLRKGMETAMRECGVNASARGISSLFVMLFPYDFGTEINSALDVFTKTDMFKNMEFQFRMLNHGVYLVHGGGVLCTEHTEADIDNTIEAAAIVAKEMA